MEKKNTSIPKIIGTETTYIGHEKRLGGHGVRMLITGIFRYDEKTKLTMYEDSEDSYITDNDHLARLGGVRPGDGAEVHIWNERENRWGFVGEEVEDVSDMAIFKHLRKQ